MINLEEHFKEAQNGKIIWEKIDKECNAEHYIVFPHVNDTYNFYALLYLDTYLEKKKIADPLLITADQGVVKSTSLFSKRQIRMNHMDLESILLLLKYYAFYEFTSNITIISLTIPYNTRGENFLGIKGITKKELLCYDVYRFGDVPNVEKPLYGGEDSDIKGFMSLGET